MVESPKLFPNFSERRNLMLLARITKLPKSSVDRVLEVVGLSDRQKSTFSNYSLGMKPRLAIGAALLKDPDLLLLDEPANGLGRRNRRSFAWQVRQLPGSPPSAVFQLSGLRSRQAWRLPGSPPIRKHRHSSAPC